MAWNSFIICFYLNVGSLDKVSRLPIDTNWNSNFISKLFAAKQWHIKPWNRQYFMVRNQWIWLQSYILNKSYSRRSFYTCSSRESRGLFTGLHDCRSNSCVDSTYFTGLLKEYFFVYKSVTKMFCFYFQVLGLSAASLMSGFFCDKDLSKYSSFRSFANTNTNHQATKLNCGFVHWMRHSGLRCYKKKTLPSVYITSCSKALQYVEIFDD